MIKNADDAAIKKKHIVSLAKKYHPDMHPGIKKQERLRGGSIWKHICSTERPGEEKTV